MASVTVRYGGARGRRLRLYDADEYLVVRTRSRDRLERTPLGNEAERALRDFQSVLSFEEAGVEVLRSPQGRRRTERRDEARRVLRDEPEIHFAGRVLGTGRARSPIVYTENLFVKFKDELRPAACRRVLRAHGLEVKRELEYASNAYFVEAPEAGRRVFEIAEALLGDDAVELAHPELAASVRERAAGALQWHLHRTRIRGVPVNEHANVVAAWPVTRGEGATIAVIDDGFDVDHEEFQGPNKVVAPRDVSRRRDDPRPQFPTERHGTPCAGVACANGAHGASGVAPGARLMPIRLRSALGSQNEADAISWAVTHGADVISCSWGPPDGKFQDPEDPRHDDVHALPDSTRLALEFAVGEGRNGLGCVITWAAGNGGESVDNDQYASFDKVVTVGACDDTGRRAPYSDHGDALWCLFPSDRHLPSVTTGIWTCDRTGGAGYNPGRAPLGDAEGRYTNRFGGTSSACPGAAGVAALVLARNPALRWDQVKDILRRCCDPIAPDDARYDERGHSTRYGYGRLNAKRAVELAAPAPQRRTAVHRSTRRVPIRDLRTAKLAVEVGDDASIRDVRIEVDIEHTHRGDLIVDLHPPAALGLEPIRLHAGGGTRPNLKLTYDRARVPDLQALVGRAPRGTWTLHVRDRFRGDRGRIAALGIELDL